VNAFVVKRMMPDTELAEIFRGVWPFVGVMAALVTLLTAWKGSITFFLSLFG
jgi:TRAP-type C4-dicarboxylate transport system permease large subunit